MADTIKQIGVKQQDGTYSMKDIEVDYSNVAGLSTQAISAKATADKNNKDITTYIASGSKNGENLVLTNGAGTTSNVDLSMTGATSNANGEAGFVPQPTSADVDKFLKADGSWATPPGEHYSGSSNINIDSSNNIDLTNTTVSSGTYGPSADVVGNNGTTILVPNISVDAKGRVTNITNKTYTSVDTGSKVFTGSLQEWDQLTIAQKKTYDFISNEDPGGTQGTFPADRVSYDNTVSGLTATDVQGAVDELRQADNIMMSDGVTSVEEAVDELKSGLPTLLWTNPNNELAPQTITLTNLQEYRYIDIVHSLSPEAAVRNVSRFKVVNGTNNLFCGRIDTSVSSTSVINTLNFTSRAFTINGNDITFGSGQMTYNNGVYKDWNSRCVPFEIYGIKY